MVASSAAGDLSLRQDPADERDSVPVFVSRWRLVDEDVQNQGPNVPNSAFSALRPTRPDWRLKTQIPSPLDYRTTSRHASRDQLLAFFLGVHYPDDTTEHSKQTMLRHRSFLLHIPTLSDISPALESSLLAVCTARLGRENGQEDLAARSLTLYTESLRELHRAVLNPDTRCHGHTLAACMALTMYEMSECPGKEISGYHAHISGALHLLRIRGPSAHKDGIGHSVFSSLRLHGVSAVISIRWNVRPASANLRARSGFPRSYAKISFHPLPSRLAIQAFRVLY